MNDYSFIVYIATIFISTSLAILAQHFAREDKKGKMIPNKLFWGLSMAVLIFIMGFREFTVGHDGANYILGYEIANSVSIREFYSIYTTEPGFYLLYKLVYLFFDDYQWIFIISSVITIILFYKAIAFQINHISLGLAVFVFTTTQYFYYFGIMRLGIAASIIAVAYKYIINGEKKQFIIMVVLATLFHYSALFSLIFLFIDKKNELEFKSNTIIKLSMLIPLSFLVVRYGLYPFIKADRYQGYINSSGIVSMGFVLSALPFLVLFSLEYTKLSNHSKDFQFYYFLFIIKTVTEMFSPLIGIGRMVWYVNLSMVFLFPALIRINKEWIYKYLLFLLMASYCILYSYYAYFMGASGEVPLLPYENVFFR